ncbi:MAG: RDD family protein [Acidimicrobiales bacterium]
MLAGVDRILGRRGRALGDRRAARAHPGRALRPRARLRRRHRGRVHHLQPRRAAGHLAARALHEPHVRRGDDGGPGWALAFLAWWFTYLWACIGLGGRTVGKGLAGIRVVGADLAPAPARAALVRAVAFPFSFVLGLGFVPAVLGRRRRALHDLVAGTQELVDPDVVAPSAAT